MTPILFFIHAALMQHTCVFQGEVRVKKGPAQAYRGGGGDGPSPPPLFLGHFVKDFTKIVYFPQNSPPPPLQYRPPPLFRSSVRRPDLSFRSDKQPLQFSLSVLLAEHHSLAYLYISKIISPRRARPSLRARQEKEPGISLQISLSFIAC